MLVLVPLSSLLPNHSFLPAPQEVDESPPASAVEMEKKYRRLLLKDPDDFEALRGWARALAAQGRGNEALPSLVQGADRRLAAGIYDEAADILELAASLDPDSAGTQARLGRALILARRYLSAEAPLRLALSHGDRRPEWLLQLAGVLWEKGDLDEAEDLHREAVERVPASPVTWHQLGRFLLWRGSYEEAAEALGQREVLERALVAFELALEQAPEHSGIHWGLARVLQRLGDGDAARRELGTYQRLHQEDQARTRQKGLTKARLDHAYELLRQERTDEAIGILTSLPQTVEVLQALAITYREAGDPQAALMAVEGALSRAPDRADLRALRTEIALALGNGN